MSIIHSVDEHAQEHWMMRSNPLYAPDGMSGGGHTTERFDDGLVHNHHWAVTADEAYPSHGAGSAIEPLPLQSYCHEAQTHDRHDDGLVHNHDWAVRGQ
jgi:hypothetical protein